MPREAVCQNTECAVVFLVKSGSTGKFCGSSCSAKVNNRKYPKRVLEGSCIVCGKPIRKDGKYCSGHSGVEARQSKLIEDWLSGIGAGGSEYKLYSAVRLYLLESANYSCEECNFNTVHPVDGKTILEIDHINGNGSDHSRANLKVLCPNCHALTSTYRGRNKGNGRNWVYKRIRPKEE